MTSPKDGSSSPVSSTGTDPLMVEHPDQDSKAPLVLGAATTEERDTRSRLDRFLQGYTKFMGPGIHQDRGLKLLQWSLWMFSYYATNDNQKPILRDALKKLYNELSFARYVIRLLQLPTALEAARSGSWSAASSLDSHKSIHKILGQVMAWSMIGYYPLEHGAYVQWQAPRLLFPKTGGPSRLAEKLSAWSCRFWLAYIVAEMVQCYLKLREESQKLQAIGHQKKTDEHSDDDDDDDEEDSNNNNQRQITTSAPPNLAAMRSLRLQIVRDCLFAIPALQWALPNWDTDPWLPTPVIHTMMWLESVVCMYQSITNFQQS
jgi:Peroxisomal biogenesis factor 11 (PEX11)